ncbi:PIR Superfamily Protein [Plasmodium ovale wallikeri]|uniref:PIR Superfamily Protein n=1 Tax=Plasmodium ovale wallikeri TaxID=864142 RepID=A0A1A9ALC4_PLAOA|nr:PIR Superfamily Protein [Plasmodium ovale wallikeri]SBT56994.1 PIR Superfamily Protein [Plasmodium ovale wallikeri]
MTDEYPFLHDLSLNDINAEGNAERITDNTTECTKYIKALTTGNRDYMNICNEFLKNLDMLTLLQEDTIPRTCVYCKNWVYKKIQSSEVTLENIKTIFQESQTDLPIDSIDKCMYEITQINEVEFQKRVRFYNFSEKINVIVDIMKDETHAHYSKCCKYVSECVDLYIKNKSNCAGENKSNVPCTAIEAFKSSYEGTLRSAVKNINKFPSLSLISNSSEVDCSTNNPSASLHKEGQTMQRGAMEQYQATYHGDANSQGHQGDSAGPGSLKLQRSSYGDESNGVSPSGQMLSSVVTPIGITSGVSFVLYILYMFTPIRQWLLGQKQAMNKIQVNLDEDEYDSLTYTSLSENTNIDNREYSVQYHSVKNT